jgi:hypothetical protein
LWYYDVGETRLHFIRNDFVNFGSTGKEKRPDQPSPT